MSLDVYVLGAGASKVHGAPLTDEILPYAFEHFGRDREFKLAKAFLRDVFHYRPARRRPDAHSTPSLVDALSVVDLALDRGDHLSRGDPDRLREGLRDLRRYDPDHLRKVRAGFEYAIVKVLEKHLRESDSERATRDLVRRLDPSDSAVISLNYDVVVDRALMRRREGPPPIDYGVEFANVGAGGAQLLPLLKLHGSLNWLESTGTGDLYWGGWEKEVLSLYGPNRFVFVRDYRRGGLLELPRRELRALMITPTHLKDLRNPHVSALWRRAETVVRQAHRLTFIGYSLPGDDIHVKYLFKRALATSDLDGRPEVVVVDYEDPADCTNPDCPNRHGRQVVKRTYERFFGYVSEYHPEGFAAFAAGLSGRAK